MKLEEAKNIGIECDLYTPEEWVLNIERHCMSLFPYAEIVDELSELESDYYRMLHSKNGVYVTVIQKADSKDEEHDYYVYAGHDVNKAFSIGCNEQLKHNGKYKFRVYKHDKDGVPELIALGGMKCTF